MVSIVIPVYNAEKTIKRCVDSCLFQTFKHIEIVCVNDGSLDSSPEILSSYDGKIVVINQINEGVVAARKKGVDISKGEWIYFLDSDDYLPCSAIADLVACIDDNTDVVFGNQVVVATDCLRERVLLPMSTMSGLEYSDYSLAHGQGTIGGKMFRKSLCEKLEIDEEFQLNEDLLMNVQMGLLAREVHYCAQPNYYYWWGSADSLSKQINEKSMGSIMSVNRRVKDLLLAHPQARYILDSGYVNYTLRNAEQLYEYDFNIPNMHFVLNETRRIALHHPKCFLAAAGRCKGNMLPFIAQLMGVPIGRFFFKFLNALRTSFHKIVICKENNEKIIAVFAISLTSVTMAILLRR